MLNADIPIPQWWIDLQVAHELQVPFRKITQQPIYDYWCGVVSLMAKGMIRGGVKPTGLPPKKPVIK